MFARKLKPDKFCIKYRLLETLVYSSYKYLHELTYRLQKLILGGVVIWSINVINSKCQSALYTRVCLEKH